MLKIPKLSFNSIWTENFQMYKLNLEKQGNQRSNCQHPLDHRQSKGIPKIICFIDYTKAFDRVDHNKLWKILKEMGLADHLTWLLRNLYAGLEATEPGHEKTDWFKIGKGVHQGCILSPCLLTYMYFYALEKEMATHSSVLAWRVPGTG